MQLRALTMLVLSAGFLSSCGEDTTTPTNGSTTTPSTTTPSTTSPAPAANRPPGRVSVDFQPKTPILAGATAVSLAAMVEDPDKDELTYRWDVGPDVFENVKGGGLSYTYYRGGDFKITVTVSDGKGGTSTGETTLHVNTLEGEWVLVNPTHQAFSTYIRHNGRSLSGQFSSGKHSFTGNVNDGNRVFVKVEDGGDFSCLSTGNYNGTINTSLDYMDFPGVSCKGFALARR